MLTETDVIVDAETIAGLLIGDVPLGEDQAWFLLDVLASAPDEALTFLAGQVERHTARGGEVGALRALRSNARGRHVKAAVALLAARAAEGAGDSTAACDLIGEALAQRPDLEPALHDAAQYAAARGDYLAAESYVRRAQQRSPLQPGLTEVLAAGAAGDVPRNSPCPCGSGRKFKACCRRGAAPALPARVQLLYAPLGTYAERAPGIETIAALAERTEDAGRYAMFCVDLVLFPGGLVERFLAARGHWLRPEERDLIEAWRQVPVTLYETLDVQRGTGVTLRALPDGEPIHLADKLFSTCAERSGLFCG
ncbi:MAG: SEC-C domain-containing protein, partial [Pseudonocardiaceae bacterium]